MKPNTSSANSRTMTSGQASSAEGNDHSTHGHTPQKEKSPKHISRRLIASVTSLLVLVSGVLAKWPAIQEKSIQTYHEWLDTPQTPNKQLVERLGDDIYDQSTGWQTMRTVTASQEAVVTRLLMDAGTIESITQDLDPNYLIFRDENAGFAYHMVADIKFVQGKSQEAYEHARQSQAILERALRITQGLLASPDTDVNVRTFLINEYKEARLKYLLARNYALLKAIGIGDTSLYVSMAKQLILSEDSSVWQELQVKPDDSVTEPYLSTILKAKSV